MSVRVNIPVRVRVDRPALETRLEELQQTVAAAAERAMASSVDIVLASRGKYLRTCVRAPTFTWGGPDLADMPGALRRHVEGLLADTLLRAARRAGVTDWGIDADEAPDVLPPDPSETFDGTRYNWRTGLYQVASYDAPPKGEKKQVPLDKKPSAGQASDAPDWASVAVGLRDTNELTSSSAFYEIRQLVLAWDKYAIAMVLLGLRADGGPPTWLIMRALRKLSQQDPGRFRALLRALRAGYEGIARAAWFERGDTDVKIYPAGTSTVESVRQLLDILGGLIYVARNIPEARPVADEWEASARGLGRIAALLGALAEKREELSRYLLVPLGSPAGQLLANVPTGAQAPRFERTDPDVMTRIRAGTANLLRYQAVTLIQVHQSGQQDFAYQLQLDLVENIRWIEATRRHVLILDTLLLLHGGGAGFLEEAKVLREIRTDILRDVAEKPMPTTARAVKLREAAETRVGDWIGIAADRRLDNLRRQYALVVKEVDKLHDIASSAHWTDTDIEFNNALKSFKLDAQQLGQEIAASWSGERSARYLAAIYQLEQRAAVTAARTALLSVWRATIAIMSNPRWHKLGSESDRKRWGEETAEMRGEVRAQYPSPDIPSLGRRMWRWSSWLEKIADDMRDVARRERNRTIGIAVVSLVVTAGAGFALGALKVSALTLTLGEAATFTFVSAVGQRVVLGKQLDPGEVITEFAATATTFGAFRVLNIALATGAGRLFPRDAFAQLATVFAGNVAVTAGVPLLISYIDQGKWPEDAASFLVGALLIHTIGAALGAGALLNQPRGLATPGPALLKQLRALLISEDVVAKIGALQAENAALGAEWRTAVASGTLNPEKAASIQRRAIRIADESAAAYRRLTAPDISDAQLSALKLPPRPRLLELADLSAEYGAALRAMPNPGRASLRVLPPPTEVVTEGLVPSAGNTIEFNPNAPGARPDALAVRFRQAGYVVKEEAGVLRLFAPGEDVPRYLLLPAGPSMPAPALARLVVAGERNIPWGIRALQAQNADPTLEATLTSKALTDPGGVRQFLYGMGSHFKIETINHPESVLAIKGIAHALKIGIQPSSLSVALGLGRMYGRPTTLKALGQFNDLLPADLRGIDAIVTVFGDGPRATDAIIGIGRNFVPSRGVYGAIGDLAPYVDGGFDKLLGYMVSQEQNFNQAALGSLLAGRKFLAEHPGSRIRFEFEVRRGETLIRVRDIHLTLPPGDPLEFITAEVKEVADIRVLRIGRSIHQFARDVEAALAHPPPVSFRPLARIRWLVRTPDNTTAAELKAAHDEVKQILRRAFDENHALRTHPKRDEALQEFEQHFDEMVVFF